MKVHDFDDETVAKFPRYLYSFPTKVQTHLPQALPKREPDTGLAGNCSQVRGKGPRKGLKRTKRFEKNKILSETAYDHLVERSKEKPMRKVPGFVKTSTTYFWFDFGTISNKYNYK